MSAVSFASKYDISPMFPVQGLGLTPSYLHGHRIVGQEAAPAGANVDMRAATAFLANPALLSSYLSSSADGTAASARDRGVTQLLRWLLDSLGRQYTAEPLSGDQEDTAGDPGAAPLREHRGGDTGGLEEGQPSQDAGGLADVAGGSEPWKPYLDRYALD